MASIQLTNGALAAAKDSQATGDQTAPATLKLTNIKMADKGRWTCTVADGSGASMQAALTSQIKKELDAGRLQIKQGAVVQAKNYVVNMLQNAHIMMILDMEMLQQGDGPEAGAAGSDATGTKADQQASPSIKQQGTPGIKHEHTTPEAPVMPKLTPGPTPSPSEEFKMRISPTATPAGAAGGSMNHQSLQLTPPMSASPLVVSNRTAGVQPIAALNPYQKNWCIKAKVVRKGPARSFNGRGGATNKVFNVELADAMGTQIQGTFWREAADKYLDALQEGKVYYFSTFSVKPANKQYATVKNDYELHFDNRTEIEEAADQSGISAAHQLELVSFDKLIKHVGRRVPIDVMGVVTQVGSLGTVKRKADSSELPRRDITLADSSRFSVVLTLWNENATRADLDGCEGRVMQVTRVRVNDYNGCSLSAGPRSEVTVGPDSTEAADLKAWWDSEGSTAHIEPLGQAAAAGGGGAAGGARSSKLELLDTVMPEGALPPPDAKPTYHDVVVAVTQVMEDRLMYLANPENGKKVEERDGRYWCEGDGRFVESAEQRYVISARAADATRETYVSIFNQQGTQLLGCTADEAAALQQSDPAAFSRLLRKAQWSDWSMVLMARSREYNGDRRMRYTVTRMAPMDYATEGHRLLQLIQQHSQQQC